jgi:hypothetical protein
MNTIQDLERCSSEFFARHWPSNSVRDQLPIWREWKPFLVGSVPNHDLAGCYALFRGAELQYVGLGASRGAGAYTHHRLSRRLMSHVISWDKERGSEWSKLKARWAEITCLYTIGVPHEFAYLSPSLESFLIRELKPPGNARI